MSEAGLSLSFFFLGGGGGGGGGGRRGVRHVDISSFKTGKCLHCSNLRVKLIFIQTVGTDGIQ